MLNVSVFGVILVPIFPAFSTIRTEYGEIRSISLYSVPMRENAGKIRARITPSMDTFQKLLKDPPFCLKSLLKIPFFSELSAKIRILKEFKPNPHKKYHGGVQILLTEMLQLTKKELREG